MAAAKSHPQPEAESWPSPGRVTTSPGGQHLTEAQFFLATAFGAPSRDPAGSAELHLRARPGKVWSGAERSGAEPGPCLPESCRERGDAAEECKGNYNDYENQEEGLALTS